MYYIVNIWLTPFILACQRSLWMAPISDEEVEEANNTSLGSSLHFPEKSKT